MAEKEKLKKMMKKALKKIKTSVTIPSRKIPYACDIMFQKNRPPNYVFRNEKGTILMAITAEMLTHFQITLSSQVYDHLSKSREK